MEPPVLQVSDQADRPRTQPEAVSVLADRLAGGVKAGTVQANGQPGEGVAVRPVMPNGLGSGQESAIAQPHSPQLDGVGQATGHSTQLGADVLSNAASLKQNQIMLGGGAQQSGGAPQTGRVVEAGGTAQAGGPGQGGGAAQAGGPAQAPADAVRRGLHDGLGQSGGVSAGGTAQAGVPPQGGGALQAGGVTATAENVRF